MQAMPRPDRSAPYAMQAYADLPDEVLQQVLNRTVEVAESVRTLIVNVDERKAAMRDELLRTQRIRKLSDLPSCPDVPNVSAVDGGMAIERSLGSDTALAVAVGIEGLTNNPSATWSGVQYAAWQRSLPHEGEETATACRGIMAALELAVLRDAPHRVVLLDGSHLTPVIALNAMLSVSNDGLRGAIAEVARDYDTANALRDVMQAKKCVAIVKYDGSRDLSESWLPPEMRGPGIGLDDRTLMSLLLEEGEYTQPINIALSQQSKQNWLVRKIDALNPVDEAREGVRLALNDVIEMVRSLESPQLYVTYFRPFDWSPAFRLEMKHTALAPDNLSLLLCAVQSQIVSPEIREPYPQWVADRMAKSVGNALVALRAAINFDLVDSGLGEYVALIAHSYRTEAY